MFDLALTEQEVNIILAGLGELPAKHSLELIAKIKTTCESQIEESKIKKEK
jgi:hypothetical protein